MTLTWHITRLPEIRFPVSDIFRGTGFNDGNLSRLVNFVLRMSWPLGEDYCVMATATWQICEVVRDGTVVLTALSHLSHLSHSRPFQRDLSQGAGFLLQHVSDPCRGVWCVLL